MSEDNRTTHHALCLDIGNSRVEFGVFSSFDLLEVYSLLSSPYKGYEALCEICQKIKRKYRIEEAIISSVVPSIEIEVEKALKEIFALEASKVSLASPLGIEVHTDNPSEVGSDLLCDAIAAASIAGGDCLIADLGTASKLIYIGENGDFEGVAIGVGLGMGKKALGFGTSFLPEVDLKIPLSVIGRNTVDSINSALTYGKAEEIRGLARRIEEESGKKLKKILTGGYGELLSPLLGEFTLAPNLVLRGANIVLRREKGNGR